MITVEKLLEGKGRQVWHVSPDDAVHDAVALMAEKGIGALVVLAGGRLAGIVSERDCARKVILQGLDPARTRVRDIMSRQVFYASPEEDVEACLAVMSRHHIRHLPVLSDEEVVGVIAMGDVVKEILGQQQDKIEQLERYISWEESY
ncbi:MAG TPA: CBS domain-containing protein [Gammaproteobacteria bacterium]|nr:CBS domain-containing protein [Gammaproteobacteria bacterium]